jgi:hypothetical protein
MVLEAAAETYQTTSEIYKKEIEKMNATIMKLDVKSEHTEITKSSMKVTERKEI